MGPDFKTIEESIKQSVAKYKDLLQTEKIQKYMRDTGDYLQNKVYCWDGQKREERQPRRKATLIPEDSTKESEY